MNLKEMFLVLKYLGIFLICSLSSAQDCPTFSYPINGATDVPLDATLTWPEVLGYNGYLLSIGTTPMGNDILDRKPVGIDISYTPPLGFPDNTRLYATLSLVPFDGPPIACQEISFTTIQTTSAPSCSILIAPDNNASSVTIITDLEWAYAPGANGYKLSMGTTPNGTDLVDNLDVQNVLSFNPPEDLPQNSSIYVRIVPYNDIGTATSCPEEVFTTSFALYVCDPYVNENTGDLVYRAPQINLPNIVGICSDELPYTITTDDDADGFRWYLTNSGSEESLISQSRSVDISIPGRYRFEAYNTITTDSGIIECTSSKLIDIVASEAATITAIDVVNFINGKTITISAIGDGQYEYALDNRDGPYQDIPIFNNIPHGPHIAYVRDKNGCGITERSVDRDIVSNDFPAFFTPNGDGINDYWQFVPPPENFESVIDLIFIFNQYGGLLKQINPNDKGWDGTFNNKVLPESDYWFRASFLNRQEIIGHFSLKR
jgi:gliding motility-associated-like protein